MPFIFSAWLKIDLDPRLPRPPATEMLPRVLANWTTGALGENAEGGVLRKGGELDASWSGKVAKESQER